MAHGRLRDKLGNFGDEWEWGIGKLGDFSGSVADALQQILDATSLYATAHPSKMPLPPDLADVTIPDAPGVVVAAVPLPELPEVAAVVMGAAPTVSERGAMAVFASAMAHAAHLMPTNVPDARATEVAITMAEAFGMDEAP